MKTRNGSADFFVLGLLGILGCSPSGISEKKTRLKAKSLQVADFTLPVLGHPKVSVTLSDIAQDHSVLLVFWATWCPECCKETVQLNEIYDTWTPKGLSVLAINVKQDEVLVKKFIQENKLRYPVLLDRKSEVAYQYQVDALPTVILLAKGGKILYYGFRLPKRLENYLN